MIAPENDDKCEMNIDELEKIPSHRGTTIIKGWNHSSFIKPSIKNANRFFKSFVEILEATSFKEPEPEPIWESEEL